MKPTYKRLFLTLLALALGGRTLAQTETGQIYKARFRTVSWDSVITDLNYAEDGKPIPVTLLPNARSAFYDYVGTDPLQFFREVSGTDGKLFAQVAGSVPLSEFHERTLLMFFGQQGTPRQYHIASIDDSDTAIPPGGYCFFNLSQLPLKIDCAASHGNVPPGKSLTLRGNPGDSGSITYIQVIAQKPDGSLQRAYSNRVPFGKTMRTLVFVFQDPATEEFEVKRLGEDWAVLPKPSPRTR
jgi:hypothetical protein